MGLFEAIFAIFLILKVIGVINWPWLIIFSPLFVVIIYLAFFISMDYYDKYQRKKEGA